MLSFSSLVGAFKARRVKPNRRQRRSQRFAAQLEQMEGRQLLSLTSIQITNPVVNTAPAYGTAGSVSYDLTINRSDTAHENVQLTFTGLPTTGVSITTKDALHFGSNTKLATTLTITDTTGAAPVGNYVFAATAKADDGSQVATTTSGPNASNTPFTVSKANATISAAGYNVTYDGNTHVSTGTATGVGGANLNADLSFSNAPRVVPVPRPIPGPSTTPITTTTMPAAPSRTSLAKLLQR